MMQQNAGDFGTGSAQKQSSPGSTLLALYTNTCAINWDYTPLLVGNKLPFKIITDCMSVIVGKLCRLSMTIIDSEIGLDIVKSVETYFQKTDFDKVMDDIFIIDLLLNQKDFEAAIEQGILQQKVLVFKHFHSDYNNSDLMENLQILNKFFMVHNSRTSKKNQLFMFGQTKIKLPKPIHQYRIYILINPDSMTELTKNSVFSQQMTE